MNTRPQPNAALTELLRATGELDRILNGQGLAFTPAPAGPPPEPPAPFIIEPANWEAEEAERQAAEHERHRQELAAELERLAAEDVEPRPAQRRRWRP